MEFKVTWSWTFAANETRLVISTDKRINGGATLTMQRDNGNYSTIMFSVRPMAHTGTRHIQIINCQHSRPPPLTAPITCPTRRCTARPVGLCDMRLSRVITDYILTQFFLLTAGSFWIRPSQSSSHQKSQLLVYCIVSPFSNKAEVSSSVVVLEESPCPRGSSRTNFQVLVLFLGNSGPRNFQGMGWLT